MQNKKLINTLKNAQVQNLSMNVPAGNCCVGGSVESLKDNIIAMYGGDSDLTVNDLIKQLSQLPKDEEIYLKADDDLIDNFTVYHVEYPNEEWLEDFTALMGCSTQFLDDSSHKYEVQYYQIEESDKNGIN